MSSRPEARVRFAGRALAACLLALGGGAFGLAGWGGAAAAAGVATEQGARDAAEPAPAVARFRKGINLNPWFTKPAIVGTWSRDPVADFTYPPEPFPTFSSLSYAADLAKMRAAGFDFVRAPISPGPFLAMTRDARVAAFENIGEVLATARSSGLDLMIELHAGSMISYERIVGDARLRAIYVETVLDMISVYSRFGFEHTLFETINEPSTDCGDPDWEEFQREIVGAVTTRFPEARLAVTGSCWSSVNGLVALDVSDLPVARDNLYATFHYYSPFSFTHQGNTWAGDPGNQLATGLVWPADGGDPEGAIARIRADAPRAENFEIFGQAGIEDAIRVARDYYASGAGPDSISSDFDRVTDWARAAGVPADRIILGEFGVLKRERKWLGADDASAARWIAAVRGAAEARGFGWSMWSYDEGMALTVANGSLVWHQHIIDALGLAMPVGPSGDQAGDRSGGRSTERRP